MNNIEGCLLTFGVSKDKNIRFFNRVDQFNAKLNRIDSNTALIQNALVTMVELHIDQNDRADGSEYIEHPLNVAIEVLDAMIHFDAEIIIATLLHDSVEDQTPKLIQKINRPGKFNPQELALDVIEKESTSRVRSIVSALTNPNFKQLAKENGIDSTEYQKWANKLYAQHVQIAIQDPDVALIKIFDFKQNALNLNAISQPAKRIRLQAKYNPLFKIMIQRLNNEINPLNIKQNIKEQLIAKFLNNSKGK